MNELRNQKEGGTHALLCTVVVTLCVLVVLVNFLIPTEANSSSMSICLSANSEVGVTLRVSHSRNTFSLNYSAARCGGGATYLVCCLGLP